MGYALFISHRLQRHLDEVQIASAGFASSRGWVWGGMATVLLLAMPPVTNGLIDLANTLSTGSPDISDHGAVRLALFFGLILRSEEHTSELQSLMRISYAVFCLKNK